jgi:RND family efflux transporter MFP subunit
MRYKKNFILLFIIIIISFILFYSKGKTKNKKNTEKSKITVKKEKKLTRKDIMKKFNIKGREDFKKLTPQQRQKFFAMMQKLKDSDTENKGLLPLVKIKRIEKKPLMNFLTFNTTLEPEKKVPIYSKVDGIIKKIIKEEGAKVNRGDILALIDDKDIRTNYEQAKLSVRQAELNVKDALIKKEDEEANFKRSESLFKEKIISEKDFATARLNKNSAVLSYERALQQLDMEKEKFKGLELQLAYTKIRTPIDGWITERKIDQGTRVNPGTEVYIVEDFTPLLARVFVPEKDIVKLEKGQKVIVKSEVYNNTFEGKIKIINPRIDPQSGTFKVTINIFDKTGKLRPGMLVSCNIVISKKEGAIIVPKKAVFYQKGNPFVYLLKRGGKVKLQKITIGEELEKDYEILSGIKEGNIVITQGIENIKDGAKVKII